MDIKITKGDVSKRLSELGIIAKDFIVSSIEIESDNDKMDGRDGYIDMGATFGERTIVVPFYFEGFDLLDVPLVRDELFRLVMDRKPFYIQEMRRKHRQGYKFVNPNEAATDEEDDHELFQKRYKVRLANSFEIEQTSVYGEGELVFVTVDTPFAESVGTTQDELTFTADVWQFGQGLYWSNDGEISYSHNTSTFRIYNAGDVEIDPRDLPLEIIFRGKSSNLQVTNNTTGDVWMYNGTTSDIENIFIRGVQSFKNSTSIFKDTNKSLITLAVGWNDFTITGTNGPFLIDFNHKFYYY